jgi:CelD/BcsL family acetyltransferase involved in cellulose biosynthesis
LQISVAHPSELGPGEIAAWHSMQRQTASLASPFFCPEFTVAVGRLRPDARVAVLHDGPELAGFFPFERRKLGVGVPIGFGLNNCQGVIHAPGAEWDPRALLRACRLSIWHFNNLTEGQEPFGRFAATAVPAPVIDLADGFEKYWEKLRAKSHKFCRELGRKERRLEREAGQIRFVHDSRDMAELRVLIGWKSEQFRRTGALDIFTRPWIISLIDQFFSIRNEHFGMLLSVLKAGDTPVAAGLSLRSGELLGGWLCAYDLRFAKQSPGLLQHLRAAKEAAALGIRLIEMGTGQQEYKQTLKTHDLFVGEGAVTGGPVLAGAHRARAATTRWASEHVKRYPPLFRAADMMLRQSGRIG